MLQKIFKLYWNKWLSFFYVIYWCGLIFILDLIGGIQMILGLRRILEKVNIEDILFIIVMNEDFIK